MEFLACVEALGEKAFLGKRLYSLTANDFFNACALGYRANDYKWAELSAKEQYLRLADGRDEGLRDIPPDSPDAFYEWFHSNAHFGGHPWEVSRGGNSTHIDLFVVNDKPGYHFCVAGSSWSRCVEAIKFFLALYRAGLPVGLTEAATLADRLTGDELIGIVPYGILPVYCSDLFSREHVIDFAHLDDDPAVAKEEARRCTLQPIPDVLLAEGGE